jgi:hypothetical protein
MNRTQFEQRREAMRAFVGSRKNRHPKLSVLQELRRLRRGTRLKRLS